MFRSEEVIIDQTATGWEHRTVQISHCKPNSKKYVVSNIQGVPKKKKDILNIQWAQKKSLHHINQENIYTKVTFKVIYCKN